MRSTGQRSGFLRFSPLLCVFALLAGGPLALSVTQSAPRSEAEYPCENESRESGAVELAGVCTAGMRRKAHLVSQQRDVVQCSEEQSSAPPRSEQRPGRMLMGGHSLPLRC